MKKIIALLAITLMSVTVSAKAPQNGLTVDGKFINTNGEKITYDLFYMDTDSCFQLVSSSVGKRFFSVQVLTGATYLMRFTKVTNDSTTVKYLLINPINRDNYSIHVDFSNDNSAELYWYSPMNSYLLRSYNPDYLKLEPSGVAGN